MVERVVLLRRFQLSNGGRLSEGLAYALSESDANEVLKVGVGYREKDGPPKRSARAESLALAHRHVAEKQADEFLTAICAADERRAALEDARTWLEQR
jgi:hypothetical protein